MNPKISNINWRNRPWNSIHLGVNSFSLSIFIFCLSIHIFGCAPTPKPTPIPKKEAGWVSLTGLGVPSTYKMDRLISTGKELVLKFQVNGFNQEIKREKMNVYQKITIPEAGVMTEIGKPNLPVIRELVAVPKKKTVRISITDTSNVIKSDYNVYPVQPPVIEQGPYRTEFTIDQKFYQTNQLYPGKLYSVSKPMIIRGQPVVQIEIFPMQYIPGKRMLKIFTQLKIKIDFIESEEKGDIEKEIEQDTLRIELPYLKEYKKLVNFDYLKDQIVIFWGANYLIITADEFADEIAPLAAWKRMKGLQTRTVKMSSIGTTDNDIRNYIRSAYNNWRIRPTYVLLVGDVEYIPTHYYHYTNYLGFPDSCATDLYYVTVDGDDFLPDIAIGRFSAKTDLDVICIVNKTIKYEKTPPVAKSDWYHKMSLVSDWGYFENTSDWVYDFMTEKGYAADRFYKSLGTAKTSNISDATNEGRIILNYRGHGDTTRWNTGPFSNSDILSLTNNYMTPIIISPTCLTGFFDAPSVDCFGETWLKSGGKEGKIGGVDFWGSSRVSFGGYNDELCKGVYKASFDDGISGFGDITNQAKLYMFNVYGTSSTCELEFNLFNVLGDPELNVWFQIPTTLAKGWEVIDLDILGGKHVGGITKEVRQDVGSQNAFPVLSFPYSGGETPACFVTFSVPSDWDGLSDFLVEFLWYSPTEDGNVKWAIVYDRKDVSKTPYNGFNRHIKYSWWSRKARVSHSSVEIWSMVKHGPINPGDLMTLGLERLRFSPNESGGENAITENIYLISARAIYKTKKRIIFHP